MYDKFSILSTYHSHYYLFFYSLLPSSDYVSAEKNTYILKTRGKGGLPEAGGREKQKEPHIPLLHYQ